MSARLLQHEVLDLARYSARTLARRVREGRMPAPIDRGREHIYDGEAVRKALRITNDEPQEQQFTFDPQAIKAARARALRDSKAPEGRNPPGAVRASTKAAPLRLVADNADAHHGRAQG